LGPSVEAGDVLLEGVDLADKVVDHAVLPIELLVQVMQEGLPIHIGVEFHHLLPTQGRGQLQLHLAVIEAVA